MSGVGDALHLFHRNTAVHMLCGFLCDAVRDYCRHLHIGGLLEPLSHCHLNLSLEIAPVEQSVLYQACPQLHLLVLRPRSLRGGRELDELVCPCMSSSPARNSGLLPYLHRRMSKNASSSSVSSFSSRSAIFFFVAIFGTMPTMAILLALGLGP